MPLNLLPLSWQFDPKLALLRGVSEESLLAVLAAKHLGVKFTGAPSVVSFALILPFD
jgi:hypothetical protein